MPADESGNKCKPEDENKIMHMSLIMPNGGQMLGSDVPKEMPGYELKVGNNVALSLNATSREDADKIFNGLSAGGNVTMPLDDTFWGAYFGMWTDKFGVNWMVNYDDPSKMQS